jgi:cation:H+ antiporter
MAIAIMFLVVSLGLILFAAEGFTNGIELVGRRLSFSQAVVGSILAAVGTALPETILPMVAIFSHGSVSAQEIGVGAILGAPFMLSTIGFFLIGVTAFVASRRGGRCPEVRVEPETLKRDLTFFLMMYSSAVFLPIIFGHVVVVPLAILLVAGYIFYVVQTASAVSADMEHLTGLHIIKLPVKMGWVKAQEPHIVWAVIQIVAALVVMVCGAHLFVQNLSIVSASFGMSPLLFALLIAPIATELPEKFNSVTWTLKGKDTLAVGNMTGAMVFQSTFPVSVGLLFTSWCVEGMALVSAVLALLSAAIVLWVVASGRKIAPVVMMVGGVFYVVYAIAVIVMK